MSDDGDDSENCPKKDGDGATGDSASPSESPRDKKQKLSTTECDSFVPASRRQPLSAQDLLVAGIHFLSFRRASPKTPYRAYSRHICCMCCVPPAVTISTIIAIMSL